MTADINPILESVYSTYCALTGMRPNFKVWERDFYGFVQAGYTPDDLRCVLVWILRENRKYDAKFRRSNSLMKLLGNEFKTFDSYLSEARATERNLKPVLPKQQIINQFRGFSERETHETAKRVGEIINGFSTRNIP